MKRTLVGMEVHLQLRTKSKMFCRCPVRYGAPANTLTCPVCLGLPGSLPVPNRDAMLMGLALATALGCEITEQTKFDRKNYFYADLPKGYQISQFDRPLGTNGKLEIVTDDGVKEIRIRRLHIEEDVGKSVHEDDISRVDFNRAGTPLVEIVTEPDMRSPEDARAYLTALRTLVQYLDISDANMQEGNLRCEPNVNIHIKTDDGVIKTPVNEIKNLNSVRHVERAIKSEVQRHIDAYRERGAAFADEPRSTLGYDEKADSVYVMRNKEEAHDYRYFPEPDIPPIHIGAAWRGEATGRVPELPWAKRARFAEAYGLNDYDANTLCRERGIADYFEQVVNAGANAKQAANWIQGEVGRHANDQGVSVAQLDLPASRLASMIELVENGTISRQAAAKTMLPHLLTEGGEPAALVAELGLAQVHDEDILVDAARKAIEANPKAVTDFQAGKEKALGAMQGFVMRETRGKANPKRVQEILRSLLEKS